ncbi:MAG: hypothetical protein U0V70_21485 [Terriglobia bacterium]
MNKIFKVLGQVSLATALAVTIVILFVDLQVPLGVTITTFYVLPILITLMSDRREYTLGLAVLSSLLVILGLFLSPDIGVPRWITIIDRSAVILVIWITAFLGTETNRAKQKIREMGKLLTICAWTKQVKVDDEWISIEDYLIKHCGLKLTHGITKEAQQQFFKDLDIDIQ